MDFEMDNQEDDARPTQTSPHLVQEVSLFYLPENRSLLPLTKSNHPHTYPHHTLHFPTESALPPWVEFLLQTYPPHHLFRQTILRYLLAVPSYLMRYYINMFFYIFICNQHSKPSSISTTLKGKANASLCIDLTSTIVKGTPYFF